MIYNKYLLTVMADCILIYAPTVGRSRPQVGRVSFKPGNAIARAVAIKKAKQKVDLRIRENGR